MFDPYRSKPSRRGRTNLASCVVATVFLLFVAAIIVTVYFFVFKPKSPRIAVDAVRFPTFSISNGTVNFTFLQYVSVTNPNRDQFTHYDSSLQLSYSGQPVGVVFIPAGKIDAGRTQHMSAKFNVQSYPLPSALKAAGIVSSSQLAAAASGGGMGMGPTMVIETRMKLVGRVRVLKVLTHRVASKVRCGVVIQVSSGSVLGIHC
ncbi:PREDICTED: uncharacterized protein LOC109185797 [Ipomoea nil]|uniref:uncharacterized protein LOC109185797 n=1 Tax=Ipomoea nil TaxID=35883 RepID=UPI000901F750|nr:PREDICTED: uncharacterized protein LOC109185797 [Ipomoea nil]